MLLTVGTGTAQLLGGRGAAHLTAARGVPTPRRRHRVPSVPPAPAPARRARGAPLSRPPTLRCLQPLRIRCSHRSHALP